MFSDRILVFNLLSIVFLVLLVLRYFQQIKRTAIVIIINSAFIRCLSTSASNYTQIVETARELAGLKTNSVTRNTNNVSSTPFVSVKKNKTTQTFCRKPQPMTQQALFEYNRNPKFTFK